MTSLTVRTRFAPSPTGYLHIGSARTALFNYLFAKHHQGQFLLRIEDTDKERSTEEAKDAILKAMNWLDLAWDGEIVYQASRADRHREVAEQLLREGRAYYCYSSQEDIAVLRDAARAKGEHFIFKSPWRTVDPADFPKDQHPVVRLKTIDEGQTVVHDLLQGDVVVENSHLDDMILLRSDGTPTYMLAVVVDDHDMAITHIIRGDDHLNNASRQQLIYEALGWQVPQMVHIPLIHGPDGAKLSKRHGALGAEHYRDMGYLPEAINNYLLRLGWSHGDSEFITREQAVLWFDVDHLGKSPSRIDFDKMKHMNAHYMRLLSEERLIAFIEEELAASGGRDFDERSHRNVLVAKDDILQRAELVSDITPLALMYFNNSYLIPSKEARLIIDGTDGELIDKLLVIVRQMGGVEISEIQDRFKEFAKSREMKLGDLMKIVRALVAGQTNSPSMFAMIAIIGHEETIRRIEKNR